jgi:CheY-like chemotaxis protein
VEHVQRNPLWAGVKILMLTSAGGREDAARCRELGLAAYLIKPVKQSELLDAILLILRTSEASWTAPETEDSMVKRQPPLRILVAEDNPVNQQVAVSLLNRRGHTVVVAGNGREALAALENQVFDLVLMDVQMPEMDGLQATALIREKEKTSGGHLPIVAMTAHAMKGDRERCLAAGMDRYVVKPIHAKALFTAIEELAGPEPAVLETAPPAAASSEVFDVTGALARLEGNREVLRGVVAVFLEDCPKKRAAIRRAVAQRDGQALHAAAHALKGAVSNFGGGPAFEAALALETMEFADPTQVEQAAAALDQEVERLRLALEEWQRGSPER